MTRCGRSAAAVYFAAGTAVNHRPHSITESLSRIRRNSLERSTVGQRQGRSSTAEMHSRSLASRNQCLDMHSIRFDSIRFNSKKRRKHKAIPQPIVSALRNFPKCIRERRLIVAGARLQFGMMESVSAALSMGICRLLGCKSRIERGKSAV